MNPASMTKILSLLVAAEHLESMEQLNETFTITLEMTDFAYVNGLSTVGFLDGEQVPVKDLFYGTILPSGGDVYATLQVAVVDGKTGNLLHIFLFEKWSL